MGYIRGRVRSNYEKKHKIDVSKDLIEYIRVNKLPVFYNGVHFVQKLYNSFGYDDVTEKHIHDVYKIASNTKSHYNCVYIPKRDGTKRKLSIPSDELKEIQEYILNHVLVTYKSLDCVMAYTPKVGIKHNALKHVESNYILKLDIHDFFGSIRFGKVVNNILPKEYDEGLRVLLASLCMLDGGLPQGAPTSPKLSNMVMYKFDEIMYKYALDNNIVYTRYADDMYFSSKEDFDYKYVIRKVRHLLKKYYNMELNDKKSVYMHEGKSESICGIVVNEKVQVSKKYRNDIRQEMYYLNKVGVEKHIYALYYARKLDKVLTPLEYYKKLLGKINYVLYINPSDAHFIEYRDDINERILDILGIKEVKDRRFPRDFDEYLLEKDNLVMDVNLLDQDKIIVYSLMNKHVYEGLSSAIRSYRRTYLSMLGRKLMKANVSYEDIEKTVNMHFDQIYVDAYDRRSIVAIYLLTIHYYLSSKEGDKDLFEYWSKRLAQRGIYRGIYLSDPDKVKYCADKKDAEAQYVYAMKHLLKYEPEFIKYMLCSADNGYKPAYKIASNMLRSYKLYVQEFYYVLKGVEAYDIYCAKRALQLSKKLKIEMSSGHLDIVKSLIKKGAK